MSWSNINSVFWYAGMADALLILIVGLYGAGIILFGKSADYFWNNVFPACATIVGTSGASACVVWVTRYAFGS
jgi:hypothetical protein